MEDHICPWLDSGGPIKLTLASVSLTRCRPKSEPADTLARDYIDRAARFNPAELALFPTEAALLENSERQPGRPAALLILFDSRGETLTSEHFAELIARGRDHGAQRILVCIGPADGWSAVALQRAARVVSLGRMTLPHELARAVAAEQVYRALTILAGHPYHSSH